MSQAVNPKDILGLSKPPLHLVPPALALFVSQVLGFSAGLLKGANGKLKEKVYGPYNWRSKPVKLTIYIDAIERHLLKLKDGEYLDDESGQPHFAHIAANCGIVLDAEQVECLVDDRTWMGGRAPQLIEAMTEKTEPAPKALPTMEEVQGIPRVFTCGCGPKGPCIDHR